MKKRAMALLLALSMTMSMIACGTEATDEVASASTEGASETTILEGASIDFEDGNIGFVTELSYLMDGDPSELNVSDYNGSKALVTTNVYGKSEVYIGIDVQALLGDRVADVKTVQFDIGAVGDSFNAVSGKVYSYTGIDLTENNLGTWSVYLASDNPKTISLDMPVSFEAGAGNYLVISKESDAAEDVPSGGTFIPTEIAIDNIGFFDADGNVIEADTTATIGNGSKLLPVKEEPLTYGRYVRLESVYAGDNGKGGLIAPEYFANDDRNVTVTINYTLEEGYDNYLIAPCLNSDDMKKLDPDDYADLQVLDSAGTYHLQEDGYIAIDDPSRTSLSFTVTADACKDILEAGGLTFEVVGVTGKEAIVSDSIHRVDLSDSYAGDWEKAGNVSGAIFDKTEGVVNITVNYILEDGFDYYLVAPVVDEEGCPMLDAEDYVDLIPATEAGSYHLQDDGFIAIDDLSRDSLSFTITEEAAAKLANNGGLNFQVYGVTATSVIVSDSTYHTGAGGIYPGDWGTVSVIPLSVFAGRDDMMGITVDYNIESDYDSYLIAPVLNTEGFPTLAPEDYVDLTVAETGSLYHLQDDGFIVIDDLALDSISFTITADAAAKIADNGGLAFQVYGVNCQGATASTCEYIYVMSGKYPGDWSGTVAVPAAYFTGTEDMITVTPYFGLEQGYDYYVLGPARNDNGWPKFTDFETYYVGALEEDNGLGLAYHFQHDGFISIEDWSITHAAFTLSAEGAKKIMQQNGMLFQVMGETVKYVTIVR